MQDAQCGGRIVEAEPDVAIAVGAGHVLEADAFQGLELTVCFEGRGSWTVSNIEGETARG